VEQCSSEPIRPTTLFAQVWVDADGSDSEVCGRFDPEAREACRPSLQDPQGEATAVINEGERRILRLEVRRP